MGYDKPANTFLTMIRDWFRWNRIRRKVSYENEKEVADELERRALDNNGRVQINDGKPKG